MVRLTRSLEFMERGRNAVPFSKGEKGGHKSASFLLTCVCTNGILKSASARLLGPSAHAPHRTDTAGRLPFKTATSQAVIKVAPQLIAGGKCLFKCLHFYGQWEEPTMCLSRHNKGAERFRQQRVTLQVAELEYSPLVMSYLNSESILPEITRKCDSGQHWQKNSPALSASVPRDSPRRAAASSVLGNHFLPQCESAQAKRPL